MAQRQIETQNYDLDSLAWELLYHPNREAGLGLEIQASNFFPAVIGTFEGAKASILQHHGIQTLTRKFLAECGLDETHFYGMISATNAAEEEYKQRAFMSLVGDYARFGFPHQAGIALAKLVAHNTYLQGHGIQLPFPIIYTDWVYGWRRGIDGGAADLDLVFNKPSTDDELKELYYYYERPDSQLFSVHGQAIYNPITDKVRAGVSVVLLGNSNPDKKILANAMSQSSRHVGVRAGGIHIPEVLEIGMVVPPLDELLVYRGSTGPMSLDEAVRIIQLDPDSPPPRIPLHHTHKIPLLRNPPGHSSAPLSMKEYDIRKIESEILDLDHLIDPEMYSL